MQTLTMNDQALCGLRANDYDFTDKRDGRRVTGTTYYASFVTESPLGAPVEVKVNEAQFRLLEEKGFGCGFNLVATLSANNNKIVYTADSIADAHSGEVLRAVS